MKKENGFQIPPKSACVGCPLRSNSEWKEMQKKDPIAFQEAIEFDEKIRDFPGIDQQAFLHKKRIPLKEIQFENKDQLDWFNECEGLCGI